MASGEQKLIRYRFHLDDGECLLFEIPLSLPSLQLQSSRESYPAWAALDYKQCPHCPLSKEEHPQCPLAANLVEVVEVFRDGVAMDEAETIIETPTRTYGHRAPLAQGLSAMIGLIMVTSGCPYLDRLRPMAHTHLPFATKQETVARAMSTYLLAQFFARRRGREPDWELENFVQLYDDINIVNEQLSQRLAGVCHRDASLNALTKLDCFASITAISVEADSLEDIEAMFSAYFEQPPAGEAQDADG